MPGGREAEHHPGEKRDTERKGEHPAIDRNVVDPRDTSGAQCLNRGNGQVREQKPETAAQDREHQAFREQLQHQPAAAGAERSADRHLLLANGRAHEQQVRDVCAGDEDDDRDGGEQREERRADRTDDLFFELDDLRGLVRTRIGILLGEPLRDRLHLGRRLSDRDVGFEPGDHREEVAAARRVGGIQRDGAPELYFARREKEIRPA